MAKTEMQCDATGCKIQRGNHRILSCFKWSKWADELELIRIEANVENTEGRYKLYGPWMIFELGIYFVNKDTEKE